MIALPAHSQDQNADYVRQVIEGSAAEQVWASQLDNPRIRSQIFLENTERAEVDPLQPSALASTTWTFAFEPQIEMLPRADNPFGSYGSPASGRAVGTAPGSYLAGDSLPLEFWGARLGTGITDVQITKRSFTGNTLAESMPWKLEDGVIIVPVSVYAPYRPGGHPLISQERAQLLFDDVPDWNVERLDLFGGFLLSTEVYGHDLVLRQGVNGAPSKVLMTSEADGQFRPDEIFAQCGIQFRLAEYISFEVPAEILDGQIVEECQFFPFGNCECLVSSARYGGPVDQCLAKEASTNSTGSSIKNSYQFLAQIAKQRLFVNEALFEPGWSVYRHNLVTRERLQPGEHVAGAIQVLFVDEVAGDRPGLEASGTNNEIVVVKGTTPIRSTLAHEIGHVLLEDFGTEHDVTNPSALMTSTEDSWGMPGCDTWATDKPAGWTPYACEPMVGDYACADFRGQAGRLADQAAGWTVKPSSVRIESSAGWRIRGEGEAVFSALGATEGQDVLVLPEGYAQIESPGHNTTVWPTVGTTIALDVYVPLVVPNPYWVGSLAVSYENPAAGLSTWLGQVELTGEARGVWSTIEIAIPESVRQVLLGDFPSGQFVLATNTALGATEAILVDNLRFAGTLEQRTLVHTEGSSGQDFHSGSFFGFEDKGEWAQGPAHVFDDQVNRIEGSRSLGVLAEGWTVVTSREFGVEEIPPVTGQISLDVYIPDPQPNPYWVGDVHLYVTCPSAGVHNLFIGNESLTNLFVGEFNQLSFNTPAALTAALSAPATVCSVSIVLNVNDASGAFALDRLGFR